MPLPFRVGIPQIATPNGVSARLPARRGHQASPISLQRYTSWIALRIWTPSAIGFWNALRPLIRPTPPARLLTTAVRTAIINKRAGGMGLISGRKAFQKPMAEGVELLQAIQDVYLCEGVTIA